MKNNIILKKGDKVHYQRDPEGFAKLITEGDSSGFENGIVKRDDGDCAFVVYHCGGEWEDFENYTAARTRKEDLEKGWL